MTYPLAMTTALAELADDDARAELRFCFDERAAIREHDGGLCRDEAESLAMADVGVKP